jgi:hypothetical protein
MVTSYEIPQMIIYANQLYATVLLGNTLGSLLQYIVLLVNNIDGSNLTIQSQLDFLKDEILRTQFDILLACW